MFVTHVVFDDEKQAEMFMREYCDEIVEIGRNQVGVYKFKGDYNELRSVAIKNGRLVYVLSMDVQELKELCEMMEKTAR